MTGLDLAVTESLSRLFSLLDSLPVGAGVLLIGVKNVVIGLTDLGMAVPESNGVEGQLTKLVALFVRFDLALTSLWVR